MYDTYKLKLCVMKYSNPFKTFKIGKKNYASHYKGNTFTELEKPVKGKLKLSVKKGWKISKIYHYYGYEGKKKIRNNKKIELNTADSVEVILQNKKYGASTTFTLNIYDGGDSDYDDDSE